MKKQYKLGVIGCSPFTTDVLRGAVLSDTVREKKILVADENEEELDKLDFLGVRTTTDYRFTAENCEFLLIAVKPKKFEEVCKKLEGIRPEKVISIMSGISKNRIKNGLGIGLIKVARCEMNLPCSIGSGVVGIDMLDFNKSSDDCDFISKVFGTLGAILSVEERKLDAVSAINADGAVYSFMFIDALIEAGVNAGLTKNEAKIIAVQTLLGSAEMAQREENSLDKLTVLACNNGGALVDSVKNIEEKGFRNAVCSVVETGCATRAKKHDLL